ncbi:adhesion G-protein coupled receptor G4 [Tachysurus vachellii]|uniref:adhesion G-protein coupled receptor G4 n=1 Tax=Tachysurus vachellii TaxID=175792 RepID=UPI00296AB0D9|nr:adhesion G-protein coupled receptor G4 [Tachysurus vachellii]XP_060741652.1 adhesion G-protein coupled receptor G4 [Tachysurus vachellii]
MGKIKKCLAFTVCVWIFGSFLLCSVSANPSLWGKKVDFLGVGFCHWQLSKTFSMPSLVELSVCADLKRWISTTEWTAFVYNKPGGQNIELGLGGMGGNLKAWLFGYEWVIAHDLPLQSWHTICLTWSNLNRNFQLIINGTVYFNYKVNESLPSSLAPNGTLTLGISHRIVGGVLDFETGKNLIGEMTLFRMWGFVLTPQQLTDLKCISGNIVTWSMNTWEYQSCPPIIDNKLKCECPKYRINMEISITQKMNYNLNIIEIKEITEQWLKDIFPPNILLNYVFISHLSQRYKKNSQLTEEKNTEIKGGRNLLPKTEWFRALVYMTVSPAAAVDETQALLWTMLIPTYKHSDHISVHTDLASVNILPQDFIDTFCRVHMNLTMNGSVGDTAETILLWLQPTLGGSHKMKVLNFKLTSVPKNYRMKKALPDFRYSCTFHVQVPPSMDVTETKKILFDLLTKGFANSTLTINVTHEEIIILNIEPGFCLEDKTLTVYGQYIWPSTAAEDKYEMRCEKGNEVAVRLCKLDGSTDAAIWDPPDLSMCEKVVTNIGDLESVTVTQNNSADIVVMIENLLQNQTNLSPSELDTVLQKLSDVTHVGIMTTQLANSIINVVSELFFSTSFLSEATNEIISITDQVGSRLDFSGELHNTTVPSLALQIINLDPQLFQGLTFGVSSFQTGLPPEIFFNQNFTEQSDCGTVASISLPHALENFFPQSNRSRVQFHFYGTENLFQDQLSNLVLNSYVVSASVTNASVSDLKQPIIITLLHLQPKQDRDMVQCVYWNSEKNYGNGGWDDTGCQVKYSNATHTSCLCFHLTHFGVLLDISKTPINPKDDMILTVITYLGCGLSSIFLGITVLTYMAFEKLRQDYPSKILINLSGALLGLNLLFLINSWLASFNNYGLCIAVAAILHYFFLATFTWMGLEAINMYLAFVKVFNVYVPSYILKFCALGWGLPLIIVSIVLAVDKNCYGTTQSLSSAEEFSSFCWLQNDVAFYVSVVAFVVLILVCNISMFGVVLVQIRGMQLTKDAGRCSRMLHEMRVMASLTFLLGLTWMLAFFTWGPMRVPFLYLFSLLNTLQGFFIFLFHCLMKENVRKQWRIHLCCGRFKPSGCSDWSGSVTLGGRAKSVKLDHISSETTSERKISSSSQKNEN